MKTGTKLKAGNTDSGQSKTMVDVQSRSDNRGIPINRVGVTDLRYPIVILDRAEQKQHTVASVTLSVDLPSDFKGTHMSRFVEILNEHHGDMTMWTLPLLVQKLRHRLEAQSAHVEIDFPYFIRQAAPVTGAHSLMDYQCTFVGESRQGIDDFMLRVRVPVSSLCPCSKEISDYGAHNQRGEISIEVRAEKDGEPEMIWIEELVEIAETCASAPVYALLKREDERYVTMQAYENPVFVEDMVRNVAQRLQNDSRIMWFRVMAENQESIHNHNAFAEIEWTRGV